MSDEIRLRYTGDGFMPGVPARDLTEDEVKEHGGLRLLLATGLYERVEEPPADKTEKAASKKAGKDGE